MFSLVELLDLVLDSTQRCPSSGSAAGGEFQSQAWGHQSWLRRLLISSQEPRQSFWYQKKPVGYPSMVPENCQRLSVAEHLE